MRIYWKQIPIAPNKIGLVKQNGDISKIAFNIQISIRPEKTGLVSQNRDFPKTAGNLMHAHCNINFLCT